MAKAIKPAFMSKVDALKLAESIQKRGKVLDADIQRASVSAICYSIIHRDVTIGQKLIECFPAGSRKASLVTYFETRGNFLFDKTSKTVVFRENPKAEQDMARLIPELAEHTWLTAKPEVIESVVDVMDALEKFIKRMESIASKNAESVEHREVLPKLRLLMSDVRIADALGEEIARIEEIDLAEPVALAA
jgi:hypothetical protein